MKAKAETVKTILKLDTSEKIRRHVNGPCDKAAATIIEDIGVLNFGDDDFDDVFLSIYNNASEEEFTRELERVFRAAETKPFAMALESAAYETFSNRAYAGYMLGLSVGLRLGQNKIGGGR